MGRHVNLGACIRFFGEDSSVGIVPVQLLGV